MGESWLRKIKSAVAPAVKKEAPKAAAVPMAKKFAAVKKAEKPKAPAETKPKAEQAAKAQPAAPKAKPFPMKIAHVAKAPPVVMKTLKTKPGQAVPSAAKQPVLQTVKAADPKPQSPVVSELEQALASVPALVLEVDEEGIQKRLMEKNEGPAVPDDSFYTSGIQSRFSNGESLRLTLIDDDAPATKGPAVVMDKDEDDEYVFVSSSAACDAPDYHFEEDERPRPRGLFFWVSGLFSGKRR
jgi:hypothetical protein